MSNVKCTFCGAEPGNPCITANGKPYESLGHRERRRAEAKMQAIDRLKTQVHNLEAKLHEENPDARQLKLALWYIDKAGGPRRARALLDLAIETLEKLED